MTQTCGQFLDHRLCFVSLDVKLRHPHLGVDANGILGSIMPSAHNVLIGVSVWQAKKDRLDLFDSFQPDGDSQLSISNEQI
jgi:hypothetical protein